METEEMKSLWASQSGKEMQKNALAGMLSEKSHPVLRKIKRQLLIEIIMWLVILCGYYSAFDGDRRPVPANFVLVLGLLQAVAVNVSGYLTAKNLIYDDSLLV